MKIPITLTTYAWLEICDPDVMDLTRGEDALDAYEYTFEEHEDALLQHLAINLIGGGLPLSSLDGWNDLPNEAVRVCVDDVQAVVHRYGEPCLPDDGLIEELTHLEVTDLFNDLINGIRHWKRTKLVAGNTWDEYDEALARWIDASEIEPRL